MLSRTQVACCHKGRRDETSRRDDLERDCKSPACDNMLTLVGHFMQDIGAELAPVDLDTAQPREVLFRPCMGSLQIR